MPEMQDTTKPLLGIKILVTRPKKQAKQLVSLLLQEGAEVIEQPLISFAPPSNPALLADTLKKLNLYQWIIFTSVNGVTAFWEAIKDYGISISSFPSIKFAAIGSATKNAIEEHGQVVSLTPPERYQAEGLLDVFPAVSGQRILIPRAEEARQVIVDELRSRGAIVDDVAVYRTVKAAYIDNRVMELLRNNGIDIITFTSGSTVKEFISIIKEAGLGFNEIFERSIVACIGPVTALEAKKAGITVNIISSSATISDFVKTIVDFCSHDNNQKIKMGVQYAEKKHNL